ncbi:MAG: hypothetical protein ABR530_03235 [Pyrinomonadaceae bacterium]
MKKLLNELLFGRNAKFSGLIALGIVGSIALGCNCGKNVDLGNLAKQPNNSATSPSSTSTGDSVPSNAEVESMVKETTAQFAEAVDSGDFSDLYESASSDFQKTYTLDQMTAAFKSYTDKKSVVVPVLKRVQNADAEFTKEPSLRTENRLSILVASGKFPTKPYGVRFDYEYVMRQGEWKLLKLVVNIP